MNRVELAFARLLRLRPRFLEGENIGPRRTRPFLPCGRLLRPLAALALAVAPAWAAAQTTIAAWTFEPTPGSTTSPPPSTGAGTASLVGGTTATYAAGFSSTNGWNTTNYPASGSANKTAGAQFAVSTAGYYAISFSFDIRHSNTAANTIVVQYSTAGCSGSFVDATTFTFTPAATGTGDTWYARTVDLSTVPAVNDIPNLCLRVVSAFDPDTGNYRAARSTSTYATTGTLRFDNVLIRGTPTTTDLPPAVTAVVPASGATGIPVSTSITLTFSEPVDVASGGVTLVCASSAQTLTGLPATNVTTLTLTPVGALPSAATCNLTVIASQVVDRDGAPTPMASDFTSSFTTAPSTPTNTAPTIVADPAFSPRLFINASSPSQVSGVVADPSDPARTVGIRFTVGDAETSASALTVTATSSNTTVVPAAGLTLTGSGAQRTLTIQPSAAGLSTITVTVSDGDLSSSYTIDYAASAASLAPSLSRFITGACDASAASVIDSAAFVIANDEDQLLRVFPSAGSGAFVGSLDVTSSLALTDISGGVPREVDIEASTRQGNRIYWLASHGNSSSGANRPNRSRLFATDVAGSGTSAALTFVGYYANLKADLIAWDNANGHGLGAAALGLAASAAVGIAPEAAGGNGFNIEGLTFAPDNVTAYVAFRAPLMTTAARNRALIVPVTNFASLVGGSPASGPANFGAPIFVDLGGRAIRSIERAADGRYLIIAGPHDPATGVAPKDFRLFRWSGVPADAPEMFLTDLTGRGAVGSYEGIVRLPATLSAGQTVELLTDEGDTNFYGTSICKDLPHPAWKKARVETFTLQGPVTRIHTVQGSGGTSPLVGQSVTIEGIVTGAFQAPTPTGLGGFFVQEPDALADGDPMTSEGIFVFHSSTAVNVGDHVRVTGTVQEFSAGSGTLTQLGGSGVTVQLLASGQPLPTAVSLSLPLPSMAHFEALEGMRVTIAAPLTVTDNFNLARFGELMLAPSRLAIPTDTIDPNDEPASGTSTSGSSNVAAVTAAIDLIQRSRFILDDASNVQNPPVIPYWDVATNTLRVGSRVTSLTGVMSFGFSAWRVQPTAPVTFEFAPRPATPPAVGGSLKVAGFNVLNYFNGDGAGGGFPTPRGATDATELNRQTAKTVAAINAIDAAVIGLMEMENDGDGPTSALASLTAALNTASGSTRWDYVRDPAGYTGLPGGTDQIKVAFLYQPALVQPIGAAVACNDAAFVNARAPVAQLFESVANRGRFIAVVNHFKSKSTSTPPTGADIDQNDGQGAYNASRKAQAAALVACTNGWRSTLGDDDVLLIGDFNAYIQEDPIDTFRAAGFSVLDKGGHSYVFDGQSGSLDHAVASATLLPQVTGAGVWNINADEPRILDYNLEFKGPTQSPDYYTPTPWRSSDHDPVIVGLALTPDRATLTASGVTVSEGASAVITARLSTALPQTATVAWSTQIAGGDTASAGDFVSASGVLVFAPGETEKTLTIATVDDALVEGPETFTVAFGPATGGAEIGTASIKVTIADDEGDQTVTLAASPPTISEAGGTATLTVTRTGGSPAQRAESLSVNLALPASSARFTTSCATPLIIGANSASASCAVMAVDDALVNGSVTLEFALIAATGYVVGTPATAAVTITDDDVHSVSIAVSPASASENGGVLTYTVTRTGGTATALTVNLTPPPSTSRYTTTCGSTITIPAGQTSVTCTVTGVDNSVVDGNVNVTVALAAGTGYTLGTPSSATGTLTDDDVSVVTFSALPLPGGGTAAATFRGLGGCGVSAGAARFVALGASSLTTPAPTAPPPGRVLPFGLFEFDVTTCPGGEVEVELTLPSAPAGVSKWGYALPSSTAPAWFDLTEATITGSTVRYRVRDGSRLDNDRIVNGRIIDPVGATSMALASAPVQIPALGLAGLILLAVGMIRLAARRRR